MLSIDDYNSYNPVIANLIEKHGLQSETIWFIDLREYEAKEQIQKFSDRGFQIGSHTVTHAFLSQIPLDQARWELEESKKQLEDWTGKEIEWICYPRGRYSDEVLKLAREIGYKYGRTTKLKDGETDLEKAGAHLSYERSEYAGVDPFEWAKKSGLNHFWFHTKEILERNWLSKLEEFLTWYKNEDISSRK